MPEQVRKPYVITIFTSLHPRGWCCDRGYNYIDDESWKQVKMKDVVESDDCGYYAPPKWAEELIAKGYRYVTLWTNYYE